MCASFRMASFVLTFLVTTSVGAIVLSDKGQTTAVIVLGDGATEPEKTAAAELAAYLGKVSGAVFSTVDEAKVPAGSPCVFVGDTQFARNNGIEAAEMGPEQWVMRTVEDNLVLAGGRPRGTLYAVYRFLEDVVGVHWWHPFEESVPEMKSLSVDRLDAKGAPVFRYRDIYMLYGNDGGKFAARNRLNRQGDAGIDGAYGGDMGYGPPAHVHTFDRYFHPSEHFKDHPEWFSLIHGERRAEGSQLCLTNPELRAAFLAKLKGYIVSSRAEAEKNGQPAPQVFDVSQNDWRGMCQCDNCQAITKAEETEAGPLLDFVNYLADEVRKDFPDVWIDTLAYMMTQKPPKTIRPRDNVIIRLCDTDSNFTKSITAPENEKFRERLTEWSKIAKNLRIWDYAVTYGPTYGLPLASVHTYQPDYQFYAEHNVEGVFTEHEYPILADMRDVKIWMMIKTLEDPYRDYQALLCMFTDGFYGKAGEHVRAYLKALEDASNRKTSYLSMGASPPQYRYLDNEFVIRASGLFDKAEEAVQGDATLLRRVRFARLPLDRAILVLWPKFVSEWVKTSGKTSADFPLDRETIAARCNNTWCTEIDLRLPPSERDAARAEANTETKRLALAPEAAPVPEQFAQLPPECLVDFTADLTRNWEDVVKRVQDPEADTKLTNRLELSDEDMKKYALPMPWGLYDVAKAQGITSGALRAEDVPGPGYHWYKLGTSSLGPSYYLYFFWSWILQIDVESAIDADHPDRTFDVWARIKFEGPGFPHGRPEDKNAICVERVILVKTGG